MDRGQFYIISLAFSAITIIAASFFILFVVFSEGLFSIVFILII